MKLYKNNHIHKNTINIAALVDVVFLLIIFFMTVSHITSTEQMPITLPEARDAQSPAQANDDIVFVNIKSDGSIFLGNKEVQLDSLENELENRKNENNFSITIRCDKEIQWDFVRRAIKICRDCGSTKIKVRVVEAAGK